jgi:hypothetical protein
MSLKTTSSVENCGVIVAVSSGVRVPKVVVLTINGNVPEVGIAGSDAGASKATVLTHPTQPRRMTLSAPHLLKSWSLWR